MSESKRVLIHTVENFTSPYKNSMFFCKPKLKENKVEVYVTELKRKTKTVV